MTKFEKIAKRVELLEVAYNAIIDRDKCDNFDDDGNDMVLTKGNEEMHAFYLKVAAEIEMLL